MCGRGLLSVPGSRLPGATVSLPDASNTIAASPSSPFPRGKSFSPCARSSWFGKRLDRTPNDSSVWEGSRSFSGLGTGLCGILGTTFTFCTHGKPAQEAWPTPGRVHTPFLLSRVARAQWL
uniref:cDNA FLJ26894 fis, clone RCT00440 n=1 Tax=Homo sapiens TaxID=9606 RepID=Q6ZNY1_HUMAN|nr:unnamed protein product [Homo sapiens]